MRMSSSTIHHHRFPGRPVHCPNHPDTTVVYVCLHPSCNTQLLCKQCMYQHKDHKRESFTRYVSKKRTKMKDYITRARNVDLKDISTDVNLLNLLLEQCKTTEEKNKARVMQRLNELKDKLDDIANTFIKKCVENRNEIEHYLQGKKSHLLKLYEGLKRNTESIEKVLRDGSDNKVLQQSIPVTQDIPQTSQITIQKFETGNISDDILRMTFGYFCDVQGTNFKIKPRGIQTSPEFFKTNQRPQTARNCSKTLSDGTVLDAVSSLSLKDRPKTAFAMLDENESTKGHSRNLAETYDLTGDRQPIITVCEEQRMDQMRRPFSSASALKFSPRSPQTSNCSKSGQTKTNTHRSSSDDEFTHDHTLNHSVCDNNMGAKQETVAFAWSSTKNSLASHSQAKQVAYEEKIRSKKHHNCANSPIETHERNATVSAKNNSRKDASPTLASAPLNQQTNDFQDEQLSSHLRTRKSKPQTFRICHVSAKDKRLIRTEIDLESRSSRGVVGLINQILTSTDLELYIWWYLGIKIFVVDKTGQMQLPKTIKLQTSCATVQNVCISPVDETIWYLRNDKCVRQVRNDGKEECKFFTHAQSTQQPSALCVVSDELIVVGFLDKYVLYSYEGVAQRLLAEDGGNEKYFVRAIEMKSCQSNRLAVCNSGCDILVLTHSLEIVYKTDGKYVIFKDGSKTTTGYIPKSEIQELRVCFDNAINMLLADNTNRCIVILNGNCRCIQVIHLLDLQPEAIYTGGNDYLWVAGYNEGKNCSTAMEIKYK